MGNGIPGDGNDNWKWQLRGNDGRWINMYGPVVFDYTPTGGGPAKKGHGTFQGVSSPGRAKIFVKDDPELEVGLYEVQSQFVRGVKAFIPTGAKKSKPEPVSKPAPAADAIPAPVEAPKGRRASSKDMKVEFPTNRDSSELKDEVAKKLLSRILAKGVTKDELVEMLDSLDLAKSLAFVGQYASPRVPTLDGTTGIVKWEGSKRLTEVRVSVVRTTKSGGEELKAVRSGILDVALRNAFKVYNINKKQDGIEDFNEYMTYDETIKFIRKINKIIDERYKDDAKYQSKSEIVFEDNIEEVKDFMSYSAVSNMVAEWAGSSNDDSVFSLALQDTVAKLFNLENYLPWTTREDVAENKDVLLKLHGKIISAYAEAQYEATQEELKAKGITSVELHRGMKDPELRATLDEYGSLPNNLVILRPLSSFSYDIKTARDFTGESESDKLITYEQWKSNPNAVEDVFGDEFFDTPPVLKSNEYLDTFGDVRQLGGVVLNTTVPAESIFSMPFSGVGCLSEAEVVVLGPNLRAEVIRPEDVKKNLTLTELEEEEEDDGY